MPDYPFFNTYQEENLPFRHSADFLFRISSPSPSRCGAFTALQALAYAEGIVTPTTAAASAEYHNVLSNLKPSTRDAPNLQGLMLALANAIEAWQLPLPSQASISSLTPKACQLRLPSSANMASCEYMSRHWRRLPFPILVAHHLPSTPAQFWLDNCTAITHALNDDMMDISSMRALLFRHCRNSPGYSDALFQSYILSQLHFDFAVPDPLRLLPEGADPIVSIDLLNAMTASGIPVPSLQDIWLKNVSVAALLGGDASDRDNDIRRLSLELPYVNETYMSTPTGRELRAYVASTVGTPVGLALATEFLRRLLSDDCAVTSSIPLDNFIDILSTLAPHLPQIVRTNDLTPVSNLSSVLVGPLPTPTATSRVLEHAPLVLREFILSTLAPTPRTSGSSASAQLGNRAL